MIFSSLLVFVSGVVAALLTLYFSWGRSRLNKRNLSVIFSSILLEGIGLWLFSIDHPTYIFKPIPLPPNVTYYGPGGETITIPPPSYASLWPYPLIIGIVSLVVLLLLRKAGVIP